MKHRDFSTGDIFPAGFVDALNEFLADYVGGTFHLDRLSATQIQVVAGTAAVPEVALAVGGAWRYITTTVSATAPALGAGTYPIYAVASANNTAQEDAGTFNYAFGLKLGTTPTGTTTEALFRTIGTYVWSGTAITSVSQSVGTSVGDNADTGVAAPRSIGSGASQVVAGNDPRLADARAPSGAAGGVLSGTYPSPGLLPAFADSVGYTTGGVTRGGASIVPGIETVTAPTTYTLAPTPDRVAAVVLPATGIMFVVFQATWQASVGGTGRAAIFLNNNQLQSIQGAAGPQAQEATSNPNPNTDGPLGSYAGGLGATNLTGYTGDVTTGQVVGAGGSQVYYGFCAIQAAAGTYDVSVRWKAASGNVTVKNRKLWVVTRA